MVINKKKDPRDIKQSPFITVFNKSQQRYEPVIFANGISVDLASSDFRKGIELVAGAAPSNISSRLYNQNGTLMFDGSEVGSGAGGGANDVGWKGPSNEIIYTTGSLGIGTSAPDEPLHVKETAASSGDSHAILKIEYHASDGFADGDGASIKFAGGDTAAADNTLGQIVCARDGGDAEGSFEFRCGTSGNEKFMTIASDGAVYIGPDGVTPPPYRLNVIDASAPYIIIARADAGIVDGERLGAIYFAGTEDGGANYDYGASIRAEAAGTWTVGSDAPARLAFHTQEDDGLTERMRIQHDGNVGVGTTSPMTSLVDVQDYSSGNEFEDQLDDGEGGGHILKYGTGTTVAGKLYYLHTTAAWVLTDGTDPDDGASQLLGVALGTNPSSDGMLLRGYARIASGYKNGSIAIGMPVYVSEAATGEYDFDRPAAAGEFVRVVGYCVDDHTSDILLYFNPDPTWVEIS